MPPSLRRPRGIGRARLAHDHFGAAEMDSLRIVARDAVSSIRSRVSAAICTAIMPATTNTTSAVTPATCFALMLTD
jgi:hypothetical protein